MSLWSTTIISGRQDIYSTIMMDYVWSTIRPDHINNRFKILAESIILNHGLVNLLMYSPQLIPPRLWHLRYRVTICFQNCSDSMAIEPSSIQLDQHSYSNSYSTVPCKKYISRTLMVYMWVWCWEIPVDAHGTVNSFPRLFQLIRKLDVIGDFQLQLTSIVKTCSYSCTGT